MAKKLTITVSESRGAFQETYKEGERGSFSEHDTDLEAWARALIQRYNDTLRPGEYERHFDSCTVEEIAAVDTVQEHDWHKTNAVTREFRGRYFDLMVCDRCGVTGKRYGLGPVTRDTKFKAKKYIGCKGASHDR